MTVTPGPAALHIDASGLDTDIYGWALSIDVHGCDAKAIRDRDIIAQFSRTLCGLIAMKPFGDPFVQRFGNDQSKFGYTLIQPIDTSSLVIHFAEATDRIYLDLFSCRPYDQATVEGLVVQVYGGRVVRSSMTERR